MEEYNRACQTCGQPTTQATCYDCQADAAEAAGHNYCALHGWGICGGTPTCLAVLDKELAALRLQADDDIPF